jgi:hypothetical protein
MVEAGSPARSPMRNPAGSTLAKHEASALPGFQPSAAAQSSASPISSARIARMRNPSSVAAVLMLIRSNKIRQPESMCYALQA